MALGLTALVVMGVTFSLFGGGTMTMMWTYLAESFPTKIRSNATGMVFGSARLVAVFMTLQCLQFMLYLVMQVLIL